MNIYKKRFVHIFCAALISLMISLPAQDVNANGVPTTLDSRVKLMVYNENDIFDLFLHCHHQSVIRFDKGEIVKYYMMGEQSGWEVSHREKGMFFIRPTAYGIKTNMHIVTNKHNYIFSLRSAEKGDYSADDMTYTIKFFYPEKLQREQANFGDSVGRYEYDMSDRSIAPSAIRDNGKKTIFSFVGLPKDISQLPSVAMINKNGIAVPMRRSYLSNNNSIVVDSVADQFILIKENKNLRVVRYKN